MKKLITILILFLSTLTFAQVGDTDSPFATNGWDAPEDSTTYYNLPIYRLLSNPGGWINISQRMVDSLFNALIVYTDTTELYIQNDTLRLSSYVHFGSYYDDLRVSALATKVGGSKDPGFAVVKDNGSASQGVFTYWFDDATEEELYFEVQMPHAWLEGDTIHPHLHWIPASNGSVGDSVGWGLEYTWADVNEVFGNTTILYTDNRTDTDTAPLAFKHYISAFPAIDGTGHTLSSVLICRVFRDATASGSGITDNYLPDAGLISIDFHFKSDQPGSRQEYIK